MGIKDVLNNNFAAADAEKVPGVLWEVQMVLEEVPRVLEEVPQVLQGVRWVCKKVPPVLEKENWLFGFFLRGFKAESLREVQIVLVEVPGVADKVHP